MIFYHTDPKPDTNYSTLICLTFHIDVMVIHSDMFLVATTDSIVCVCVCVRAYHVFLLSDHYLLFVFS